MKENNLKTMKTTPKNHGLDKSMNNMCLLELCVEAEAY
jgi:hypothetical protein